VIGVTPYERDPELGTGGARESFETAEYFEGWGLDRIGAAARYAEGAFGSGALVSVFDTGIDPDHPELVGAYLAEQSHSYFAGEMTDLEGHGSHVAGIVAAARDGVVMHGVAPETKILAFRSIEGPESERAGLFFENWEDAMLRSVEAGADVMNNSWTFVNADESPVRITDLTSREDAVAYFGTNLIGTMAYAAQQDLVSVYAAGNGSGGEPSNTAGLPVHIEEIRDHWVSVVALNEDDTIAGYSSQCGIAAEWCLAAPGTDVLSSAADGRYEVRSGSSMAAGFVSGSLALLKSNFPEITGATALTILKDTARDLGEAGVDPVFGHGAIDLEAAMRPVGEMSVQMSSALNARTAPLLSSGVVAPSGVADPMRRALSTSLMSTTDAYDRSFLVPLGAMVASRGEPDRSSDLTRFALRGGSAGLPEAAGTYLTAGAPVSTGSAALPDPVGFRGGHAALLGDRAIGLSHKMALGDGLRLGLTGASDTGPDGPASSYGSLSLSADLGGSVISLETGRVLEKGGMLGARFYGAFGGVSSDTRFLRASADLAIGQKGTLHLSAASGETEASGSGLLRSGRVRSESFGVGVSRRNDQTGSVMSFGASRPLGVSGGSMKMVVPVGVSAASEGVASEEVQVQSLSVDLDSGDAPLDLQFGYELPVGSARLGMAVSHRVGSGVEGATSASLGVSFRF
jgi:subtilisin family serine protease